MTISTKLTRRLGIEHPVMLAPMGFVSGGALAAAVSAAAGSPPVPPENPYRRQHILDTVAQVAQNYDIRNIARSLMSEIIGPTTRAGTP